MHNAIFLEFPVCTDGRNGSVVIISREMFPEWYGLYVA